MTYYRLTDNRYMPFYLCGDVLVLSDDNIRDGNIVMVQTDTNYYLCKISYNNGIEELLPPLSCCDTEIAPGTEYKIIGKTDRLLRWIKQDLSNGRYYITAYTGNHMEGHGIKTDRGGYVVIDNNANDIRVGDIVHCEKDGKQYIVEVKEINDKWFTVGTAYLDESRNVDFQVDKTLGVALEIYGRVFYGKEFAKFRT